ncbi:putative amidase family protein [Diplodia seriata]|uniref:Putative amidase family protein n=1 Tax=Diplodia seriata TaxID=420778 RepID=A0A0G2FQL7_9PEZI|nr:putative amidase family protein [Diplodia seriata]
MGIRKLLAATVSAAVVASATHAGNETLDLADSQILQDPLPVWFAENPSANGTADVFPMQPCNGFTLEEATIDELQDALGSGVLTSVHLVLCYLQRIQQTDEYLRAIMQLNPDSLQIAARLDSERAAGRVRGPLHGIPFLVKDNIATKDKMETTAGSYALLGSIVPRDAHVVRRLRESGALLLGHATLSEWADMRSTSYSEGYSARGGQCRSAYNLTVNPGGSSSGSAVGVAANMAAFALGTETDGSVVNPAQRNALVGIKPTVGLTSRAGVVPESEHQDTVGCLARTVRDATYCLDGIYGYDPRDNYTEAQRDNPDVPSAWAGGYSAFLADRTALRGAVFGLPWLSFWQYADADMQAQLLATISLIEAFGATVINSTELPNRELIVSPHGWDWDYGTTRGHPNESSYTYIKSDFHANLATYLATLTNAPHARSLADIVAYNAANPGTSGGFPGAHPAFASGQDGLLAALATRGIRDETYWQASGEESGCVAGAG